MPVESCAAAKTGEPNVALVWRGIIWLGRRKPTDIGSRTVWHHSTVIDAVAIAAVTSGIQQCPVATSRRLSGGRGGNEPRIYQLDSVS